MSASIFISFASQDLKVANTLCKALESRGFKCWIASRDIAPGENFQIAIVRAIRNAKIMLLVFTGNSNNSDEMAKELALASQSKLIVVPLRIDDVRPNEAFSYEFATRQWIDFFADWETAIEQLAQRIGMALGDGANAAPPEPAAVPPAMPAPTPDVIMEALAAQPAEVAKPLSPPGEAAGKTALLTPAEVAAAKPAGAGPSSLQPETPAKRGAPVMLFVALGVLVIALGAGAAVLLPSFLAKKPEPTAAVSTNAASSLALTPPPPPSPALVTQPTAATPGPAPMASDAPQSAGAAGTGPNGGYLGPSSEQPVQPSAAPSPAQEDPDLDPETHRGGRFHPRRGGGGGGGAGGGGSPDVPF
jgi:hypothetical protein